ncbi:CDP-glycerol glycerophosphotransferase family protein [Oceanobacillus halophilus]|uniref:CDP-glycerol glycerophosphotransferase family protein n=1 Tax=Oceanobacillus halophilus TaxID=930130 RepID=A0A495A475_9BACI|nr:CDP-glycerol glycerophosphotransferase family protein [Oceanobacillus halophilus]RKQ34317.1 CDP-glycerol glycerophosphotransferase family protein [Oceanobacillus halophilus]
MLRELAIHLYLFAFQIIFHTFKLFPQKKKTVAVASFGDNIMYTAKAIKDISDEEVIVLKDEKCRYDFGQVVDDTLSFTIQQPTQFIKSIYHLATATTILVDNYQGFLAVTKFRPNVTCIQLWHAAGAIKRFGLEDPSNDARTEKAMKRFQKVYNHFDYTVVGSEKMATTFHKSFGLEDDRFIRTGIPRSDILFDEQKKQQMYTEINQQFPSINGRKIILYAPTFRNDHLTDYELELEINQMYEKLSDEYVLFIKLHPAVTNAIDEGYYDFVYDVSDFTEVNSLLLITDVLITDYSSIPFEFALLERPMIFYAYDMEEYKIKSGLIEDYENQMPGPVAFSTMELVQVIQDHAFNLDEVKLFAKQWNEYSNGNASLKLARFITGVEEKETERKEILV